MDEKRRRGWLSEFKKVLEDFASETVRLIRLKVLEMLPVLTSILIETWPLILNEHIYEADALQIQACIHSGGNLLLSSDKELVNAALKAGLRAINVKDEGKIKELLNEE